MRLLQLASAALPVGSFAYSQGLEYAVEAGWMEDEAGLRDWLSDQLRHTQARVDLPILARLIDAGRAGDTPRQLEWVGMLLAMRETSELLADDTSRGRALARLLMDLEIEAAEFWLAQPEIPYAAAMAVASLAFEIPVAQALEVSAWSWLENQVVAGVKLVPLGQVAGQRILLSLAAEIPQICELALSLGDEELGGSLPIAALASSLHETQYTRLFRS